MLFGLRHSESSLAFSARDFNDFIKVIGLVWVVQRCFVAPNLAALLATMDNHPTFFPRLFHADRLEHPATIAGSVAWVHVHMNRVQAFWAVVAYRTILERQHLQTAIGAGEWVVRACDGKISHQFTSPKYTLSRASSAGFSWAK